MAASTIHSSTQTALAILVPPHLSAEIDTIRSLHDKAFGKWQPHINILYPFVPLDCLNNVVRTIRAGFVNERNTKLRLEFDGVGVFRHRKNATVYLKPTVESEEQLQQLRTHLISCIGATNMAQPINGSEYHPHLTVGQANLNRDGELDVLDEKAKKLLTIEWDTMQLAVLKRTPSGQMISSEELPLNYLNYQVGQSSLLVAGEKPSRRSFTSKPIVSSSWRGWRHCYGIDEKCQWYSFAETDHVQ